MAVCLGDRPHLAPRRDLDYGAVGRLGGPETVDRPQVTIPNPTGLMMRQPPIAVPHPMAVASGDDDPDGNLALRAGAHCAVRRARESMPSFSGRRYCLV